MIIDSRLCSYLTTEGKLYFSINSVWQTPCFIHLVLDKDADQLAKLNS